MNVLYLRDEDLVEGLKDRKDTAFEALLDMYGDKILKVCYLILKDFSAAEDVTQEVFIQIHKSIRKFKGRSSLYTWIYKIAVNKCRDVLGKRKDNSLFDDNIEIPSDISIEDEVIKKAGQKKIKEIVFSMDFKYREVVTLFYFEDLTIKEICSILDESEGTVKSKLHRARNILKEVFLKEGMDCERG